jgi:hypothetical protein
LGFSFTLCCRSFTKTSVRSGTISPVFFYLTMMSSTYASMMQLINSPKMRRMHRWNIAPTFLSPKGIT